MLCGRCRVRDARFTRPLAGPYRNYSSGSLECLGIIEVVAVMSLVCLDCTLDPANLAVLLNRGLSGDCCSTRACEGEGMCGGILDFGV